MLVKNLNVGQKSKCWSKIEILVKNPYFGKNPNVVQSWSKSWSKKVWLKIDIFVKIQRCSQI